MGDDQEFKLHTQTAGISKNGYLYVFVSNETPNINVFFDNLQAVSADRSVCITHLKGPLLEESHYYPFGTEMSAISSHSLPSYVRNRYKANAGAEYGDEEWSNGSGLEMYETFYRSYNAQTGRFMQGDPMMEVSMESYAYAGNNPVMFTDLLGDQYKYMDKMGNRWHHADVLEGTALEGQQYIEGFGLDGFGDSWIGDVQNGGGGGGKGHGSSQTDYTSQWEEIVAGFNSGKGDSWSPGYGFYDGSLYPAGVNWVKLSEVVVSGRKNNFSTPYENINEFFQDPYIIRNGEKVPWNEIKTGSFAYGLGSLIITTTKSQYTDEALIKHLQTRIKREKNVSEFLDYSTLIAGYTPISKNPIFGILGLGLFSESKVHSYVSDSYNDGLLMYLNFSARNGLWLVESMETHIMSGVASRTSRSEYYLPNGVMLFQVNH